MSTSVALSSWAGLSIALAGILLFVLAVAFLITRGGWRTPPGERKVTTPPSMKPGPPDAELDTTIFERLQGWGIVLVLMFAIWIPIYWLNQPSQNQAEQQRLEEDSIHRGKEAVSLYNEHVNPGGQSCVICHGANLEGGEVLFNGAPYPVPTLTNVCAGPNGGHPLITGIEDIRMVIEQGRAGTPMPSFSADYEGSLNQQQMDDIVNYLISINDVPYEDNVCVNPKAAEPEPSASPSAEASPGAEASPAAMDAEAGTAGEQP